jgi:hypothetical protein
MVTLYCWRPTVLQSERFIPTWLFPEEYILGSLAGLDDSLLQSVDLCRLFVGLKERERELKLEESAPGA